MTAVTMARLRAHTASAIVRRTNSSSVQSRQLLKSTNNATLRTSAYAKTLSAFVHILSSSLLPLPADVLYGWPLAFRIMQRDLRFHCCAGCRTATVMTANETVCTGECAGSGRNSLSSSISSYSVFVQMSKIYFRHSMTRCAR